MNGETNVAPALAASSAWVAEKQSVTLTMVPSPVSVLQALSPSQVSGTLTVTFLAILARMRPSRSMPSVSVAATSAETGPGTMAQISAMIGLEIAPGLGDERGIGGDAIEEAQRRPAPGFRPHLPYRRRIPWGARAPCHRVCRGRGLPSGSREFATSISSNVSVWKGGVWKRLLDLDGKAGSGRAPRVPVLLPVALDQTYDYLVPAGLEVEPGVLRAGAVRAAGARRHRLGRAGRRSGSSRSTRAKMKPITERLGRAAAPGASLRFAEWVARYTLGPLGMVVRMMMSAQAAFEPVKPSSACGVSRGRCRHPHDARAPTRARCRRDGLIRAKSALAVEAACTTGVVDGLVKAGCLVEVAIPEKRFPQPNPRHATTELSADQAAAAHALTLGDRCRSVLGVAARRRHRFRQDRGLLRGRGARAGGRAAKC